MLIKFSQLFYNQKIARNVLLSGMHITRIMLVHYAVKYKCSKNNNMHRWAEGLPVNLKYFTEMLQQMTKRFTYYRVYWWKHFENWSIFSKHTDNVL